MSRCVFLMLPDIPWFKQWSACLSYAGSHGLTITAFASDPQAAASVVDHGDAACVVVAVPGWRHGEPECLADKVRYTHGSAPKAVTGQRLEDATALLIEGQASGDMHKITEALAIMRPDLAPAPTHRADGRTYPLDPDDGGVQRPSATHPWRASGCPRKPTPRNVA